MTTSAPASHRDEHNASTQRAHGSLLAHVTAYHQLFSPPTTQSEPTPICLQVTQLLR